MDEKNEGKLSQAQEELHKSSNEEFNYLPFSKSVSLPITDLS